MSTRTVRHAVSGAAALALVLTACQPIAPQPISPATAVPVAPAPVQAQAPASASQGQAQGQAAQITTQSNSQTPALAPLATAHLDLSVGSAEWRANAQAPWTAVTPNLAIGPGSQIRTGPSGRATVTFPESSRLVIDRSSEVGVELFDVD